MKSVWRTECWKELQGRMSMWASLCPPVCPSTVSLPLDLPLRVLKRVTVWHDLYNSSASIFTPTSTDNERNENSSSLLNTIRNWEDLCWQPAWYLKVILCLENKLFIPGFYCQNLGAERQTYVTWHSLCYMSWISMSKIIFNILFNYYMFLFQFKIYFK